MGATGFEPESNVLAAMVRWVEEGLPPETIEGTKFVNDRKESGVERKRRHCRYPYTNTYVGGDPSVPDSWECLEESTVGRPTLFTGIIDRPWDK